MPAAPAEDPLGQHEDRLVHHHVQSAAADRELTEIVQAAHENSLNARKRLEQISTELEQRVQGQNPESEQSPIEVSEFHQFLLGKQKEIARILTEASNDAQALRHRLAALNYPAQRTQ